MSRYWTFITPRMAFPSRIRWYLKTVSGEVRVGTSSGIITTAHFWTAPSLIPGEEMPGAFTRQNVLLKIHYWLDCDLK